MIESKEESSEILAKVQPEDLMKYGLIPELVGRLPVVVALQELSKEALMRIISEPKNALLKQYKKLFSLDDVELEVEEDAVEAIAEKAIERKTGARGLRSIFEHVMRDVMFDVPSRQDVRKCVITRETIENDVAPTLVIGESKQGRKEDETA